MAQPTTKKEFKEWCLRKLGKPVIEINVDQDQVDDRVEEALSYYWDYHFDGAERTYFKHEIQYSYVQVSTAYFIDPNDAAFKVGDVLREVSGSLAGQEEGTATATIAKIDASEGKLFFVKPIKGTFSESGYVTSDTFLAKLASGGNYPAAIISSRFQNSIELQYIDVPENIIGAVKVFELGSNITAGSGMFNVQYQFVLNNLHDIVNYNLAHFYMSMQNLQFMEELLVGMTPMRYNRHINRIMLDTKWDRLQVGQHIVVEAYKIVDPDVYQDVWKDRWLQNYASAKIKYQWGSNLTKFNGMTLPGNVQFNGEQILNDAREEIQRLEEDMITSYSLPVMDMIG